MRIFEPANIRGATRRISAADWAFQDLWSRIVRGEIAAGERVTEDHLADLLDVSRTPLREALLRLQEIGFLEKQRSRALVVTPMSAEDAEELTNIREELEVLVARRAAKVAHNDPDAVANIRLHVQRMKLLEGMSAGPSRVLRLGEEFHLMLLELSGSGRLTSMLSHVYLAIERYRYLINVKQDRAAEIAREHGAIIEAVARGDAEAAAAAMREHISHSRRLYIDEIWRVLPRETAGSQPAG